MVLYGFSAFVVRMCLVMLTTEELIDFGVSIYHQYNRDLIEGAACASGCGFFNEA